MSENAWIEWSGGIEPPMPSSAIVDVKLRCGDEFESYHAYEWSWDHEGDFADGLDIIAYRLSGPSA